MPNSRLDRLYALLEAASLDGAAINPGPTLVYLTGLHFHLSERPTTLLLAPPAEPVLVVPALETGKAQTASIDLQPLPFSDTPSEWGAVFAQAAASLKLTGKRIAVEPARFRFLELAYLQAAAPDTRFVSGETVFASLRIRKDPNEITAMRKAAEIAQDALRAVLALVKTGMSERQLASELTAALLRGGSDSEMPFQPIVASGPNSANPHAVPTERTIQPGDLLLFDFGAGYDGYASDITRTFAIGQPDAELANIYALVEQANAAGRAAGKPGLRAGDIDHAARAVIDAGGYGPYFTHRTGHGLGMEGHEPPFLYAANDLALAEGMVYTVEPGIYLPGKGGVRIEDDLVVTADGSVSLTDFPRGLTIL